MQLEELCGKFDEADADQSGALAAEEIAALFQVLYRERGTLRNKQTVAKEVDAAMSQWDVDRSGTLEFGEFISMYALSPGFHKLARAPAEALALSLLADAGTRDILAREIERAAAENKHRAALQQAAACRLTALVQGRASREALLTAESGIGQLEALFHAADTNGNGALNETELTQLLKRHYATMKTSRKLSAVRAEVKDAMAQFDSDRSGQLELWEFIAMMSSSSAIAANSPSFLAAADPEVLACLPGPEARHIMGSMAAGSRLDVQQKKNDAALWVNAGVRGWKARHTITVARREVARLKTVFDRADTAGQGALSKSEVARLLKQQYRRTYISRSLAQQRPILPLLILLVSHAPQVKDQAGWCVPHA